MLSVISITVFFILYFLNYHGNRLFLYFLVSYRISIISLLFWVSIPNPASDQTLSKRFLVIYFGMK